MENSVKRGSTWTGPWRQVWPFPVWEVGKYLTIICEQQKTHRSIYFILASSGKAFKSKILMYLFEDAGKHCPRLFEKCSDQSKFSSILNDFREKGIGIFGFDSSMFEE